eukprot:scaffold78012_cov29-Tisochrysis_lutea.AAC.3
MTGDAIPTARCGWDCPNLNGSPASSSLTLNLHLIRSIDARCAAPHLASLAHRISISDLEGRSRGS